MVKSKLGLPRAKLRTSVRFKPLCANTYEPVGRLALSVSCFSSNFKAADKRYIEKKGDDYEPLINNAWQLRLQQSDSSWSTTGALLNTTPCLNDLSKPLRWGCEHKRAKSSCILHMVVVSNVV